MSIATRIENISNHLKNAYDELQGLGADLTNVNKNIENISMVLDDIYDSMPQVSGEGTSLTLDDTRVGKIKSTLKGNTSQSGIPTPSSPISVNVVSGDNEIVINGKNLLSFTNFTNISGTSSFGVTRTFNGETIILNGTTTEAGNIVAKTSTGIILKAGTYIGSITTSGDYNRPSGDVAFYLRKYNTVSGMLSKSLTYMPTDGQYSSTFTLTEDTEVFLEIYVNASNITFTNYTCKFQIEKGSSATSYEPYQGNTYNIDLRTSKNLFNKDTIINDKVLASNGTLTNASGYIVGDYIQIKPSTQYTISFDYTAKEYLRIGYYQKDKTFIERPFSGDNPWTITTPSNCYYIRICTPTNYTNIQCEEGNQQTTYEPYSSMELCSSPDGTKRDYLLHDKTLDKWYWHREIGKRILNGSETWQVHGSIASWFYVDNLIYSISAYARKDFILSDYFVQNSYDYATTITNGELIYSYQAGGGTTRLVLKDTDYTTVADFKTWLSTHNVTLYYVLATPTNTEITYQPLIDQLNLLEKAMSKDGQTNISQANNDLPFIIRASALIKNSD